MPADRKIALDLEIKLKSGEITLGELNKQLELLGGTIQEQKDILIEFERELLKLESIQSKTSKTDLTRQKQLKDQRGRLTSAIKDQRLSIKELKNTESKATQVVKKYSDATKTLGGTTKKLEKNLKGTKDAAGTLGGTLNDMSGVTGGLGSRFSSLRGVIGGVVKSFKTLRGAIIATGIGALVLLLVSLQKAFTTSEEGQNKFAKLMGVIGAVTGNLIDLLADFGEKVISVFENPKQAISDFANLIKENITNRFEGLVELIPKLGEAITLVFKGKFSEAGKVAIDAAGKVTLGVENVTDKVKEATEATKDFIKEQVKEGNQAAKVADMRAKADIIERKLVVERSKLQSKIAQLRLKARKEEEFSAAERREALLEAQELEDTLLDKETEALELRKNAQILENTFSRTDKANKDKEAAAIAAVNNQIARRANVARQLQRELNTISAQQRAEQTKADNEAKAAAKEKADALEAIRQAEIFSIEDKRKEELRAEKEKYKELIEQAEKYGKDTANLKVAQETRLKEIQDKFNKEDADAALEKQEKKIAELQYEQEQDEEQFELRREELKRRQALLLEDKTLTEEQRIELENQFKAESIKIDNEEAASKAQNLQARLQLAGEVLGSLSALTTAFAKDDEESQKRAFKINKAISIGQAVISTAQGIMAQLSVPQDALTGANFVKAGIVAATGAAQIATISKTQFKSPSATKPTTPSPPALGGNGNVGTQPRGFTSPVIETEIPTTKVIVTETDIRSVSRNVDGVYSRATVVQ